MLDRRQDQEGSAGGPRPATYADIEAVPEGLVAEIIQGTLVTHPRPSPRHSATANSIAYDLTGPYQRGSGGPGDWVFFVEPELHLEQDVLVPDIAGWRRARLDAYPATSHFTLAPDWVCEVLSASTEIRDRTIKQRIYAEAGVPHLWLVDPRQQLLEAFELRGGQWLRLGAWSGAETLSVPPFEAITISLANLWPLDKPLGSAEDPQALYAGDR